MICTATVNLQQTVPPEGVAVCPLDAVQYTCVNDITLTWRESGSLMVGGYTIHGSRVNDTNRAGNFTTRLTDITGNTLTSIATLDNVSVEDDGRSITCAGDGTEASKQIQLEGISFTLIYYTAIMTINM